LSGSGRGLTLGLGLALGLNLNLRSQAEAEAERGLPQEGGAEVVQAMNPSGDVFRGLLRDGKYHGHGEMTY